jgi:hypothetical protein
MSYKERRAELVRREGTLMTKYIDAHKCKDAKTKAGVMREFEKNVKQRELLKRGAIG